MSFSNVISYKRYCLITSLLLGNFLYAQNLKGTVTDSLKSPIVYANVILKDSSNQRILSFTTTDVEGKFSLSYKNVGTFIVSFSALSYKSKDIKIKLSQELLLRDVVLVDAITELNEVIIKPERAIELKKDTITYIVSAFEKGNETVVEDVLKNLPGINVDQDGIIRIGNQEVEKVMVEGDDFFKKGYRLLTKNLNAEVVLKIEIYQKYSNNRLLKGIEDSGKVAINLILKEDRKIDWFGNLDLNYGLASENRYKVRGNMMRFGKKAKHYFLVNLNNVGETSGGESAIHVTASDLNDVGTIGDGQQSNSLIYLEGFGLSLKRERFNFNNAELVSLNSIYRLSDKIKLKTNALFNWDETKYTQTSIQNFRTDSLSFTNTELSKLRSKHFNGHGELELDYDISKTKLLEYDAKYTNGFYSTESNLIFNTISTSEFLNNTNERLQQKIVYTEKLNSNKVMAVSASHIYETKPQNYEINTYLYEGLFDVSDINAVKQFSNNTINFIGLEAHFLDRRPNDNLFEIKTGFTSRNDKLNSILTLKQANSAILPDGFQNNLKYTVGDLYVNAKYKFKFGRYSIVPRLEIHHLFNRFESFSSSVSQNPFLVNPSFNLNYEINDNNKLGFSYSRNISNIDLINVFENHILTSYRNFSKGIGSPNQVASSMLSLNYNLGKWSSSFFTNTSLSYIKNHDFFSTDAIITPNYSLTQTIIVYDGEAIIANLKMDQYLNFISNNLKFNFQYLNYNFRNSVNSQELREVKSQSYEFGFEFRSAFDGFFNYHLGTKWNVNRIKTTTDFTNTINTSFMNANFSLSKILNAEIKTERYHFGNLETANAYYFLDMVAKYKWEKQNLNFTLTGQNLLNENTFKQAIISDINTSTTEYRLLPRFILLGVDFRF